MNGIRSLENKTDSLVAEEEKEDEMVEEVVGTETEATEVVVLSSALGGRAWGTRLCREQ